MNTIARYKHNKMLWSLADRLDVHRILILTARDVLFGFFSSKKEGKNYYSLHILLNSSKLLPILAAHLILFCPLSLHQVVICVRRVRRKERL